MTAESIFTRRIITRVFVFIVTLIVGLGVGQIFSFHESGSSEISPVKQVPECRRMRR